MTSRESVTSSGVVYGKARGITIHLGPRSLHPGQAFHLRSITAVISSFRYFNYQAVGSNLSIFDCSIAQCLHSCEIRIFIHYSSHMTKSVHKSG